MEKYPQVMRIRDATRKDAGDLVRLVNLAGEGIPEYLWQQMAAEGETAMDVGIRRVSGEEVAFSYSKARVCTEDENILGMLIAYCLPDPCPLNEVDDYPEIVRPLVQLEAKVPGSWYINAVATYPEHQGRGVASRLIADALAGGNRQGCGRASLIVVSENEQAKRLYGHLGFSTVASLPVVPYPGCLHGGEWLLMTRSI